MLKLIFVLALSALIGTKGNYFGDLYKCNDVLLKCQETELQLGKYNEITNAFNRNCSREVGSKWSNITRCELNAIKCLLLEMNGLDVNCENIADVIHL
ncbi:uncharacterized protein LOC108096142 [Drosophila ficusphila]|uniref:uncharacterized protein LOC108096142 n=1 Tax=Drosophila ficusphila TaxID=30025 RepID=UPI0007E75C11|nr:uncharacterized protein LOC108096142 [Drosophila ficusphila]